VCSSDLDWKDKSRLGRGTGVPAVSRTAGLVQAPLFVSLAMLRRSVIVLCSARAVRSCHPGAG
jgi:hypothetical protein